MIELPPLTGGADRLWHSLLDITEHMADDWTLIGGQMVLLHALHARRVAPRVSEDLDLVVNARARPPALPKMVETLRSLGFDPTGVSPDGVAHRFDRDGVYIDILAPDGLGQHTKLVTVTPGVTIAATGGTYALSESSPVEISYEDRTGQVPLPSIAGALVVKAGAARTDHGPKGPDRHLRDLAFLASLVEDAIDLRDHLGARNRGRLRAVTPLADEGHEAWVLLGDERDDAYAAWTLLAGLT
jgi:hypothetical protein